MLATTNSGRARRRARLGEIRRSQDRYALVFTLVLTILTADCSEFFFQPVWAADSSVPQVTVTAANRAEQIFKAAETRFNQEPANVLAASQFARACFDLAELAAQNAQRADFANRGIAACRQVIDRDPTNAAGHYYLGMNLAQLARTKNLGALKIVGEMEREFTTALALDPVFDFAGPDRNLAMLYHQAPGWPTSIGSKKKARTHLLQAVTRSPDYPENRLYLLEVYLDWDERKAVRDQIPSMERTLERARMKFAGAEWAASWADWERRWEKIKRKAYEKPKPAASPRQKQD